MFGIGEFARLGRVSVRMLRHYDAVGLLTPAVVDPASGYRSYRADQLRRLNRIVALKELGFTLQQVRSILDERLDSAEVRGMLRLRRAELAASLAADTARLAGVEARLRLIEEEGHLGDEEVVLKTVEPVRVAELTAGAAGYGPEHIGPVITPLYDELFRRLHAAGVTPAGPPVAWYEPEPGAEGERVVVHAGAPVQTAPDVRHGVAVVDLPGIPLAAAVVHHGPMNDVMRSEQILASWIEENGYRALGLHREVYLDYHPEHADQGVTELQVAVARY